MDCAASWSYQGRLIDWLRDAFLAGSRGRKPWFRSLPLPIGASITSSAFWRPSSCISKWAISSSVQLPAMTHLKANDVSHTCGRKGEERGKEGQISAAAPHRSFLIDERKKFPELD